MVTSISPCRRTSPWSSCCASRWFRVRRGAAGQTLLFEEALAALAKVPQGRVATLIASGRESHLHALLQQAGLPRRTFPAFAAAVEIIRSGAFDEADNDYRRTTHLIDAIVERYQKRPDRELDQILMLLRRFARQSKRTAARDFAEEVIREAA